MLCCPHDKAGLYMFLICFNLCSTGGVGVFPGAGTGGPGELLVHCGKTAIKRQAFSCVANLHLCSAFVKMWSLY